MYALRQINNGYEDHAGKRTDYVIIGHPEYNLGKNRAEYGYPDKWDTSPIPSKPAKSLPGDRMRKTGIQNHIRGLQAAPKASYKERALARARSVPSLAQSPKQSSGTGCDDFNSFIDHLGSNDAVPSVGPPRVTAGYGNHIRSQPLNNHYARVQDDLRDLKVRLRMAPEATKQELLADNTWKYYASHMGQGNRQEDHLRKIRSQSMSKVAEAMRPPPRLESTSFTKTM